MPSEQGEHLLDTPKSFVEHLEELRRTIVCSAIALGLGMLIAFPLTPWINDKLTAAVGRAGLDPDEFLQVLELTGGFSIAAKIIFWGGFTISLPFMLFFIGRFVFPGLKLKERSGVLCGAVAGLILFMAGVAVGYFLTLPLAIRIMLKIAIWVGYPIAFVMADTYMAFALKLLMAFGIAFELPVVLLVLGYLGIISSKQLRAKRRHVVVAILVLAMMLTPPDIPSQVLLAIPLYLLFEISTFLIWLREKRRRVVGEE